MPLIPVLSSLKRIIEFTLTQVCLSITVTFSLLYFWFNTIYLLIWNKPICTIKKIPKKVVFDKWRFFRTPLPPRVNLIISCYFRGVLFFLKLINFCASSWPSALRRWLRSFVHVHARVQGSSPAKTHVGRPNSVWMAALGTRRSTLSCSVWADSVHCIIIIKQFLTHTLSNRIWSTYMSIGVVN